MSQILQRVIKFAQIGLIVVFIYITILVIHQNSQFSSGDTVLFRKHALNDTSSAWLINNRYSKDETECVQNCIREGGVNCGGVLYFACCNSQEECISYPLGVCRCTKLLPNFRCFLP